MGFLLECCAIYQLCYILCDFLPNLEIYNRIKFFSHFLIKRFLYFIELIIGIRWIKNKWQLLNCYKSSSFMSENAGFLLYVMPFTSIASFFNQKSDILHQFDSIAAFNLDIKGIKHQWKWLNKKNYDNLFQVSILIFLITFEWDVIFIPVQGPRIEHRDFY